MIHQKELLRKMLELELDYFLEERQQHQRLLFQQHIKLKDQQQLEQLLN